MSHPEHETFVVNIPIDDEEAMKLFQEAMDAHYDEVNKYVAKLADELKVNNETANNIHYLRSRSRWSQELENKLIQADQAGKPFTFSQVINHEV